MGHPKRKVPNFTDRNFPRLPETVTRSSCTHYYLDEYTFRFNRRTSKSRNKLFYRLMEQAVKIEPVTGLQIRGGSSELGNHKI
jgi:hypothetical protein